MAHRRDCVVCTKTGSLLLKKDAVYIDGKPYRPEIAEQMQGKDAKSDPKSASQASGGTSGASGKDADKKAGDSGKAGSAAAGGSSKTGGE